MMFGLLLLLLLEATASPTSLSKSPVLVPAAVVDVVTVAVAAAAAAAAAVVAVVVVVDVDVVIISRTSKMMAVGMATTDRRNLTAWRLLMSTLPFSFLFFMWMTAACVALKCITQVVKKKPCVFFHQSLPFAKKLRWKSI